MREQPKAAATRANSGKKTHETRMKKWILALLVSALMLPCAFAQRMYDGSGRQLGRVDAERYFSASGSQIGRIDGERLYSASGSLMGRMDGDRLYDGSGRQIGRADGLRRMQMIVFFYFFM